MLSININNTTILGHVENLLYSYKTEILLVSGAQHSSLDT